jgi:enoyl-CoA hydratase/carnithine racemase
MAVQAFKLALTASLDQPLENAIAFTAQAQRIVRESDDHMEALRAYAEKRLPQWKGC